MMEKIGNQVAIAIPEILATAEKDKLKEYYATFMNGDEENNCSYVSVKENKIVGFIFALVRHPNDIKVLVNRTFVNIELLGTDDFINNEIGMLLFDSCKKCAKSKNASSLDLFIWEHDKITNNFYKSLGMEELLVILTFLLVGKFLEVNLMKRLPKENCLKR